MSMTVIRRFETNEYLKSFDPDVHEPGVSYPTGYAVWTDDPKEAMVFGHAGEAVAFFRTQSKVTPWRPDGKPNCPLTMFSVSFEDMKNAL